MSFKVRERRIDTVFVLMVACLFGLCSVFIAVMGAQVYRKVVQISDENFESRTGVYYVLNKLRASDETGGVRLADKDGITVLEIAESGTAGQYQTYLYFYDGAVRELLTESAKPFAPADGLEIVKAKEFNVEETDGLFTVSFRGESGEPVQASVRLRSTGPSGQGT